MVLKKYQKEAVDKLLNHTKRLILDKNESTIVFKSPTGSGKTIMIADFLLRLSMEETGKELVFIWASTNDLHTQSKSKLETYLADSNYTFSYLDQVTGKEFSQNEIAFVNWESLTKQDKDGDWSNVFMRDSEQDHNLPTFIKNTKSSGKEIVLIVDESHNTFWSPRTQELVSQVIAPNLIIEVSATPKIKLSAEDVELGKGATVTVPFEEVVESGIIKSEIIINPELKNYSELHKSSDEALIEAALEKRSKLKEYYAKAGVIINPLVMIQLPSISGQKMSSLDLSAKEKIEKILYKKHDITKENGKLAVWLSEEKTNLAGIENLDAIPEVLIFKQAIALGWDCPRADILVMLREMKSISFKIQTVGRILRMPEATHYEIDELNQAFVFSNVPSMTIEEDDQSQRYFKVNVAHRKASVDELKLPSVYLSRIDFGDLTLSFRKAFFEEADKEFGITKTVNNEARYKKADIKLELYPEELRKPVISDVVLTNIDEDAREAIVGNTVNFDVPEDEIKFRFEQFAKLVSLPFAPVRSYTTVQMAIYDWFDSIDAYKDKSRLVIQRAVVCSEDNQKIFMQIMERAKNKFRVIKKRELISKQRRKEYLWSVPPVDYYNDNFKAFTFSNYALDKCYLNEKRSEPEKELEKILKKSTSIEWWFKNGESKEIYFGIPYTGTDQVEHIFYPDFIVKFKDGKIGIYDTKSGFTASSPDASVKSNTLQAYIQKNKKLKLTGGLIVVAKTGMHVYDGDQYTSDIADKNWKLLNI
ncbi:DEAD/DEAH box helicase family protein [Candidatus Nomurabacteria bacterium]|nr:DEAD/DEAH box helicase family protein [Candidatus Nomurabacteria bacterium]MCB9826664.1 DEAD/DEAH box helicase family protein [Candidatus Nomurabacteria bacterium]